MQPEHAQSLPTVNLDSFSEHLRNLPVDPSVSSSPYLQKRIGYFSDKIQHPPGRLTKLFLSQDSSVDQVLANIQAAEHKLKQEGQIITEEIRKELIIQMLMETNAWQILIDELHKPLQKIGAAITNAPTNLMRYLKRFTAGDSRVTFRATTYYSTGQLITKTLAAPIKFSWRIVRLAIGTFFSIFVNKLLDLLHVAKYIFHPIRAFYRLKALFTRKQAEPKTARIRHKDTTVEITKPQLTKLVLLFTTNPAAFYSVIQNDASASILGLLTTNDDFKLEIKNLCARKPDGPKQVVALLAQYRESLMRPTVQKTIDTSALNQHYAFIRNFILPKFNSMLSEHIQYQKNKSSSGLQEDPSKDSLALDTLENLDEQLAFLDTMPHYLMNLKERGEIQDHLTQTAALVREAKQSLPQPATKYSTKNEKLCLIMHGSCSECSVINALGTMAAQLEQNPANRVYQLAGPGALGTESNVLISDAVKIFSTTLENWLRNWKSGEIQDLETFIGGYSRGAVNCLRISYQIHQKLSAPDYLDKLIDMLPEGYSLDSYLKITTYSKSTGHEALRQALREKFKKHVRLDLYSHDPVPGKLPRIIQAESGFTHKKEFHLPNPEFDLLRKVCIVFAEHESRSMFDPITVVPEVMDDYSKLLDGDNPDRTIQILAGNHSAGMDLSYLSYDQLTKEIRDIFEPEDGKPLTVRAILNKLNKENPWSVDFTSCGEIVGQLLSLAMIRDVAGTDITSTISIGDPKVRKTGRVIPLAENITPEQELECFALIKTHNRAFQRMTDNDEAFGIVGTDTKTHAALLKKMGIYRKKGKYTFFHNAREEKIFSALYPETTKRITSYQTTNVSSPEVVKELKKMFEKSPQYAFQTAVALAAKSSGKAITFNDVYAKTYWGRFVWTSTKKRENELNAQYDRMSKIFDPKLTPENKLIALDIFLAALNQQQFKTAPHINHLKKEKSTAETPQSSPTPSALEHKSKPPSPPPVSSTHLNLPPIA